MITHILANLALNLLPLVKMLTCNYLAEIYISHVEKYRYGITFWCT